jgi:hypothetical protein
MCGLWSFWLEPASLTVFGRPIVPSRFGQRFAVGHVVENGRHLFVATGLGTSILPVRFRVPPAVAVLTLVSEQPLTSHSGLPDRRTKPASVSF